MDQINKMVTRMIDDARADGKEVNQKILAENAMSTTKGNFTNKIRRNSFSLKDIVEIANYLGMKITIKGKGHEYEIKKGE